MVVEPERAQSAQIDMGKHYFASISSNVPLDI